MMSLLPLATEGGGFGLNFNILETNLINLAIVWGVLFYFGSKFLGKTLSERRANIEESVKDAELRQQEAKKALETQNKNLADAQSQAKEIVAVAEQNASKAREEILAQAEADVERMQAAAQQDVSFQQERVVRELRQQIAEMAIARAERELPQHLTSEKQSALVDKSIASLGG